MRHSEAEKLETIRLVEDSELSVTATLRESGIPPDREHQFRNHEHRFRPS